jgi:phosphohistidine swiveling domain-containing protein
MLVASNGTRLGAVYRVGVDGAAQVIMDGKLVTIPASTLSAVDGKLTTSLSKNEVLALH